MLHILLSLLLTLQKSIYIVGMMGSGKSYWGNLLGKALNLPLLDLDKCIEKKASKSIKSIFENDGESSFRLLEKNILTEIFSMPHAIIATGGGTPCFFDNMHQMNEHGITLWLQCSIPTLVNRLLPEMAERPLLKNMNEASLQDFLQEKLKERTPFYKQSTFCILESEQTLSDIIHKISIDE